MRLIDADEAATKIASLARLARSDQQKALLGRCVYIIEHCHTVDDEPVRPAVWRRKGKEQALFGVEWECTNCDKWKAWEAWKAEEYRQRRLKAESSTISSSVERFILYQQRRNRRQ